MNPFKNLTVNLQATGPAAVIVTWVVAVCALGLFGEGEMADRAMSILAFAGGLVLLSLAAKA